MRGDENMANQAARADAEKVFANLSSKEQPPGLGHKGPKRKRVFVPTQVRIGNNLTCTGVTEI